MTDGFTPLGTLTPASDWRAALIVACDDLGRVLLQLRDDLPGVAAPGQWGVFGGQVEGEETLAQAAAREFREETGIALPLEQLQPLAAIRSNARADGVLYAFRAQTPVAPGQIRLGEGAGFAFFAPHQLGALPMVATSRAILAHAGLIS